MFMEDRLMTKHPISCMKAGRRGVAALEYALLAGLIAAVIIGGLSAIGSKEQAVITGLSTALAGKTPAAAAAVPAQAAAASGNKHGGSDDGGSDDGGSDDGGSGGHGHSGTGHDD